MNRNEILSNLLKATFDQPLTFLEKNSRNHLSMINTSIDLAKGVANLCINIGKQIKEKPAHNGKRPNTPIKNNLNPKYNTSKVRPKTPKRKLTSSKSAPKLQKTPQVERKLTSSKSNGNFLKKTPTRKTLTNNKSNSNLHNKSLNGTLSTNTSKILKPNRTQRPSISSRPSNTSLSKQYKQKTNTSRSNHSSINNYSKKNPNIKPVTQNLKNNKTLDDDSISKILSMESNMQNDIFLNHEDPLLINPITDIDFIHNDLMTKLNDIDIVSNSNVTKFNVEEFAEDHLNLVTLFLNKEDLCNLMMCNKVISRLVKSQLISNLEKERKKYEDKVNEFKSDEIPQEDTTPFKIKKNTLKALDLLNGQVLNKPFKEPGKIPSIDVLRVYCIYFQLINNPIITSQWDKREFWKKCCDYFIVENKEKIGDLVVKNITENIVLSTDNIYQIVHLIGDNLAKLFPGYFSTICGTTGLFAFVIKDVLDFFGISTDKEIQKKSYWTYKKMIDIVDQRIEKVKALIK